MPRGRPRGIPDGLSGVRANRTLPDTRRGMPPDPTSTRRRGDMPAKAVPEKPQLPTQSDRDVWERLVRMLATIDVFLAGMRLTDRRKDHELDLVALMPGAGLVVLEV